MSQKVAKLLTEAIISIQKQNVCGHLEEDEFQKRKLLWYLDSYHCAEQRRGLTSQQEWVIWKFSS